ncbi:MAG TPA: hypothetical protein VFZ77_11825 [Acidimicrobiales bacterium]
MALAIVIATVVVVVAVAVVLFRQGSPGRLSEEHGRDDGRADVVDRPGGPGAEAMNAGTPGEPSPAPPPAREGEEER